MKTEYDAPGQRYRADFPRFGLDPFAERIPDVAEPWSLVVGGAGTEDMVLDAARLAELPRVDQVSDFHCVTTWSHANLRWGGVRFRDLYEAILRPRCPPDVHVRWVLSWAHDGARSCLPLEDALAQDVLLADHLDGEPLSLEHGAPLRLVAPRHYGFKNVKHLRRLELCADLRRYRRVTPLAFMDHPRARVDLEERGALPARLLRMLYRPLIGRTVSKFRRAFDRHRSP